MKILPTKKLARPALLVSTTGVEPAQEYSHYPLKVARLPISPRGHESLRPRHYA